MQITVVKFPEGSPLTINLLMNCINSIPAENTFPESNPSPSQNAESLVSGISSLENFPEALRVSFSPLLSEAWLRVGD